jgi:hypothetical protein
MNRRRFDSRLRPLQQLILMSNTDISAPVRFNLDGRIFDMVSSTASVVDAEQPTRFQYREDDGVVWGEYFGDTVSIGRFCGSRDGAELVVNFVHRGHSAATPTVGTARSVISADKNGALLLTEDFVGPDGADHISVCREIRD